MEPKARDVLRRGVRAAVYRACWRRLDGDESGAQALLACELPAALTQAADPAAVDDEVVQAWLEEDTADFDRAVLISDLVARRTAGARSMAAAVVENTIQGPPAVAPVRPEPAPPARAPGAPSIADLLDGMFEQERRVRAAG